MEHKVRVVAKRLEDDSLVYDVRLGDLSLPAVTEQDAYTLADKIAEAINAHSCNLAKSMIDWQIKSV